MSSLSLSPSRALSLCGPFLLLFFMVSLPSFPLCVSLRKHTHSHSRDFVQPGPCARTFFLPVYTPQCPTMQCVQCTRCVFVISRLLNTRCGRLFVEILFFDFCSFHRWSDFSFFTWVLSRKNFFRLSLHLLGRHFRSIRKSAFHVHSVKKFTSLWVANRLQICSTSCSQIVLLHVHTHTHIRTDTARTLLSKIHLLICSGWLFPVASSRRPVVHLNYHLDMKWTKSNSHLIRPWTLCLSWFFVCVCVCVQFSACVGVCVCKNLNRDSIWWIDSLSLPHTNQTTFAIAVTDYHLHHQHCSHHFVCVCSGQTIFGISDAEVSLWKRTRPVFYWTFFSQWPRSSVCVCVKEMVLSSEKRWIIALRLSLLDMTYPDLNILHIHPPPSLPSPPPPLVNRMNTQNRISWHFLDIRSNAPCPDKSHSWSSIFLLLPNHSWFQTKSVCCCWFSRQSPLTTATVWFFVSLFCLGFSSLSVRLIDHLFNRPTDRPINQLVY